MRNDDIDLSKEVPQEFEAKNEPWHPEKARMNLAYWVLTGVFVTFILGIICNCLAHFGYLDTALSASIFEICRTGLLPIVTLILGFYFRDPN